MSKVLHKCKELGKYIGKESPQIGLKVKAAMVYWDCHCC